MKSNRFDFLELGEQASTPLPIQPEPVEEAFPPTEPVKLPAPVPAHGRPSREALPRLAEVRVEEHSRYEPEHAPETHAAPDPWVRSTGSAGALKPVEVFGTRGSKAGEFHFPAGLAIDSAGILFVADSYNHRLQRITPDGGVAIVGGRGTGRGQFMTPIAVAVDPDRNFYVVEQGNHRVQKFSAEGVLQFVIGRPGSRPGELRSPMGVAVAPDTGEIYIADTGNLRVQRFDANGRFLAIIGAAGELDPPLSNPQSVSCDSNGRVYVADTLANRIARYDPNGRFVGHYGGTLAHNIGKSTHMKLDEPHALAISEVGQIYITDGQSRGGRVTVVDAESGVVESVIENAGRTLGAFSRPSGIALVPAKVGHAASGEVYVSDTMNHRIIRFARSGRA